jgi:hypothetical protein
MNINPLSSVFGSSTLAVAAAPVIMSPVRHMSVNYPSPYVSDLPYFLNYLNELMQFQSRWVASYSAVF